MKEAPVGENQDDINFDMLIGRWIAKHYKGTALFLVTVGMFAGWSINFASNQVLYREIETIRKELESVKQVANNAMMFAESGENTWKAVNSKLDAEKDAELKKLFESSLEEMRKIKLTMEKKK